MIKNDDAQRNLATRLEKSYTSLPNVICDNFFNSYARCLFTKQPQDSTVTPQDKIHVLCHVRNNNSGRGGGRTDLTIKRMLTRVSEEDEEEESIIIVNKGAGKETRECIDDGDDKNDFRIFLNQQASSKSSRLKIYQNRDWDKKGTRRKRDSKSLEEDLPRCYELFCVHQASLLIHRQQVFVEAEKLAHRLAQLLVRPD